VNLYVAILRCKWCTSKLANEKISIPACQWCIHVPSVIYAVYQCCSVTWNNGHGGDWPYVLHIFQTSTILIIVHPKKQQLMNQWNKME